MAIDISEFRKQIRFDDPQTPTTTRAKYLLFYVTKHSGLRPDMEPKVIKERLDNWGYRDITVEAIQNAFDHDPEVRPSSDTSRIGAYELTPQAAFRIKALFKDSDERIFEKTVLATVRTICLFSVVILLGIIGYGLATYNENVRDLSFPEFRKRLQFDDSTTKDTDRAKFLLYFITKVAQLKPDMTAGSMADRLQDIGYSNTSVEAIRDAFQHDRQVRQSKYDDNAFQINPLAERDFEERLGISLPTSETLTLQWLWQHIPWKAWLSIILAIIATVTGSFYIGYRFSLHSPSRGRSP